jgi:hypothetical protein
MSRANARSASEDEGGQPRSVTTLARSAPNLETSVVSSDAFGCSARKTTGVSASARPRRIRCRAVGPREPAGARSSSALSPTLRPGGGPVPAALRPSRGHRVRKGRPDSARPSTDSSSTARSLRMPNRSSPCSHASPSTMSRVELPKNRHVASVGRDGAGNQAHQHLGRRLIEAKKGCGCTFLRCRGARSAGGRRPR